MPIILAVNGIVETYPIKPVGSRNGRAESVGEREHRGQHSPSLDRSALAAQTAYQQQSNDRPYSKPAVLARDLMSAPVFSLPSDSTLLDAWASMSHKGFHHIPVTTMHDTLVGMVSYRDLLHHVPELITANDKRQASGRRLAEIMTSRVISATPATEIREIARVMLDERIHAVPILDHNRRVVGILAIRDLLQGIANHGPLELWT
ncbi:MAG TPA: CBS domain-containing protein [Nitrospira sp.]|nr:CBS domain-containing protein [Nitrospira sp.]